MFERVGGATHSTNNRMELVAPIQGMGLPSFSLLAPCYTNSCSHGCVSVSVWVLTRTALRMVCSKSLFPFAMAGVTVSLFFFHRIFFFASCLGLVCMSVRLLADTAKKAVLAALFDRGVRASAFLPRTAEEGFAQSLRMCMACAYR